VQTRQKQPRTAGGRAQPCCGCKSCWEML
jgi:hypothetical protein